MRIFTIIFLADNPTGGTHKISIEYRKFTVVIESLITYQNSSSMGFSKKY